MRKFEIFLSNFCPPHSVESFTICLYKPGAKAGQGVLGSIPDEKVKFQNQF